MIIDKLMKLLKSFERALRIKLKYPLLIFRIMDKETILVFCAHSDDQILGPGATIAKYAKEGKEVKTIIFTYGEAALPWLQREEAIKTRVAGAQKADKVIKGSGVTFLGIDEARFNESI